MYRISSSIFSFIVYFFFLCRPNPDRWGTTQNNWELGTFPPTPMMPTIAPKYPSNPWDINNQRNRGKNNGKNIVFPVRTTTLTPVSTTTTTTTTTLPPSKTLKLIFPK